MSDTPFGPCLGRNASVLFSILDNARGWVRVADLADRTQMSRRTIRDAASEIGCACGNKGLCLMEHATREEQIESILRVRGQAMSMLRRMKVMRERVMDASHDPLLEVAMQEMNNGTHQAEDAPAYAPMVQGAEESVGVVQATRGGGETQRGDDQEHQGPDCQDQEQP